MSTTESIFATVCQGALPDDLDKSPLPDNLAMALPIYQTPVPKKFRSWEPGNEVADYIKVDFEFYFRYGNILIYKDYQRC